MAALGPSAVIFGLGSSLDVSVGFLGVPGRSMVADLVGCLWGCRAGGAGGAGVVPFAEGCADVDSFSWRGGGYRFKLS